MGLWLLQECAARPGARRAARRPDRRCWPRPPQVPAFAAVVDADDPAFLPPGDMPARIAAACGRTGQPPPAEPGRDGPLHPGQPGAGLPAHRPPRPRSCPAGHVDVVHIVGGGRPQRAAVPAHRRRLRAAGPGRPGRGDRARQRAGAGPGRGRARGRPARAARPAARHAGPAVVPSDLRRRSVVAQRGGASSVAVLTNPVR